MKILHKLKCWCNDLVAQDNQAEHTKSLTHTQSHASRIKHLEDSGLTLVQNDLGWFQVRKGTLCLLPGKLVWKQSYQSHHNFMWLSSEDEAIEQAELAIKKYNISSIRKLYLEEP